MVKSTMTLNVVWYTTALICANVSAILSIITFEPSVQTAIQKKKKKKVNNMLVLTWKYSEFADFSKTASEMSRDTQPTL